MRKSIILCILLLFISNNMMTQPAEAYTDELTDMASFLVNNQVEIENWQTTWKESFSHQQAEALIKALSAKYDKTVTKHKKIIKISFKNSRITGNIDVSYSVTLPRQKKLSAELVVVIQGSSWNHIIAQEYREIVNSSVDNYFSAKAKRFSCLATKENDIINGDYFLNMLINYFQVEQIQTQFDTVKKSVHKKMIYGYTPLWNQKISIDSVPMNFQIAVTDTGSDNPTYMIGTPILINEY
jgi:TATA-box binding